MIFLFASLPTLDYDMLIGAIKSYENLFTNKTKNMGRFNKLAKKGSNLSENEQRILAEISLRLMYAPDEQTRIDADILIENYRADKIRLTNEMQEGRKVLSNLKNQLENLISKRKSRLIEHEFKKKFGQIRYNLPAAFSLWHSSLNIVITG